MTTKTEKEPTKEVLNRMTLAAFMHTQTPIPITEKQLWLLYCRGDGYGKRSSAELKEINGGWDWSHVRDSSAEALEEMVAHLKQMVIACKPHARYRVQEFAQHNTSDGVAYAGKLTLGGRIVGHFEHAGQGGETQWFWDDKDAARMFAHEAEWCHPKAEGYEEEEYLEAILKHHEEGGKAQGARKATKTLTKKKVEKLHDDLVAALQKVAKKNGMVLSNSRGTFSGTAFWRKVEFVLEGQQYAHLEAKTGPDPLGVGINYGDRVRTANGKEGEVFEFGTKKVRWRDDAGKAWQSNPGALKVVQKAGS